MRESDVPPAIRAALYQATALIPGVKLLGPQTDPAGQTGLGVGFYENGQPVSELIFDQQTAAGSSAKSTFDQNGKLIDWTAYHQSKIVDTLPNYPLEPATPAGSSGTTTLQQGQSTTTTAAGTTTSAGGSATPTTSAAAASS